jgi:hypothetical protein
MPVLIHASKKLALSTSGKKALAVFERKMLRSIYGPLK